MSADGSAIKGMDERLYRMRHSAAHMLAKAVIDLVPEAKIAIGPPVENGFYYDFDLPRALTLDDLEELESAMHRQVAQNWPFVQSSIEREAALQRFADQPYKLEIIAGIPDPEVGLYTHGPFTDLCGGPHVESTGKVGAFKLMNVAGAYWRGDERRPQLQRVYGICFPTQAELDGYLELLQEAKRRDHRRIGRELQLFGNYEEIGAGLPLWLPKGAVVRRELEQFILQKERRAGYQHVYTPDIAKVDLYKTSGHWEHYQDSMFPPMALEHEEMVLRPMNCPHHITIYKHTGTHSYRDLPLRLAELGTMYRYEKSGELSGLARVRAMTLNDAHIFCRPDQIEPEFSAVVRLMQECYETLGLQGFWYRLSFRDAADTEKYVRNDALWERAQALLVHAMDELGLEYVIAEGEAAFYGPKLDVQLPNVLGKDETVSTIQIDFHLPNQFALEYTAEDGSQQRPVMIHRGIIGTFERMVAHLIEMTAGAFPLWLAPVQAMVIPIADRHIDFAQSVAERLREAEIRVEVDGHSERMNAKIRDAQTQKIPYMLVVGDKEVEADAAAVRLRDGQNLGALPVSEVLTRLSGEIASRAR